MIILRTPDHYFENLPDFPFAPHYLAVKDLRLHYVDEGMGETILCLHGQPSWSYLYRKMIPPLAQHYRVIAPDFPGFGRSDKYADAAAYSFQMFLETLESFMEKLNLSDVTLVCQDWGGMLGLTAVSRHPHLFSRLVIMNTGLPAGEPMPEAFLRWRGFCEKFGARIPVGRVIQGGTVSELPDDVLAAYEAPFPDESYKAGVASWPLLVPLRPDDPGAADMRVARKTLAEWQKPALILFSDSDPITAGGDLWFRRLMHIRQADRPRTIITQAGHFLQEDKGEEIAAHILDFMEDKSSL